MALVISTPTLETASRVEEMAECHFCMTPFYPSQSTAEGALRKFFCSEGCVQMKFEFEI